MTAKEPLEERDKAMKDKGGTLDSLVNGFIERVSWLEYAYHTNDIGTTDRNLALDEAKADLLSAFRDEQVALIDYILSRPTGELTMTTEQMSATSDDEWRDEVIQYFFNTESLMMNLDRKREELTGIKAEVEGKGE